MTDITLQHQLRQELSPQLLQSVKLLQMNSQELTDYLNRLREENPLLETEDSHRREYEALPLAPQRSGFYSFSARKDHYVVIAYGRQTLVCLGCRVKFCLYQGRGDRGET